MTENLFSAPVSDEEELRPLPIKGIEPILYIVLALPSYFIYNYIFSNHNVRVHDFNNGTAVLLFIFGIIQIILAFFRLMNTGIYRLLALRCTIPIIFPYINLAPLIIYTLLPKRR